MAGTNLDDAFAAIIKDCQAIAAEAVKNAAKAAQQDIVKEANRTMVKYYENYKPKRYKRTYNLHKAITPIFEDHSTAQKISFEIGVEYDSSKLKGYHKSNSWYHQNGDVWNPVTERTLSQDNGIPEPEWILGNFLEGIHPWAQQDSESPNTLMENFFDNELPNRVNKYIQDHLFDIITKRL